MNTLSFYFDFLSPFSYFAWLKLKKLPTNVAIQYYPLSLGVILNYWGIKGPGEVEPKRLFLLKQSLRYAEKNKIPFTTPPVHPFNPLYALRISLHGVAQNDQKEIIDALWNLGWVERQDLGDPDIILPYLKGKFPSVNIDELWEKSFSREAKQELKKNNQMALDLGVFGVPSFIYQEELFWGQDSFNDLLLWMNGERGYDLNNLESLRQSTTRGAPQKID